MRNNRLLVAVILYDVTQLLALSLLCALAYGAGAILGVS